ncbi:MAG TPA: NAD(P)H-dependent oxidoreductase [Nocardioides sp.]|nr:NAD(P)H-dependent oxidoreductase [Nocardioides sp.]
MDASPDTTLRIALIVGSVRSTRLADPLLTWLRERLTPVSWLEVDVIDLADVDLPPEKLVPGEGSPISDRLDAADGFLVLTPEYNHSFPGSLKNAIDWHFEEWAYKPVAFVSYGAGSGGSRAVEQLRQVFPEFRATTVRHAVQLSAPWTHLSEDGRFSPGADVDDALSTTLDELRWWASALREGRARPLVAP